MIWAIQMVKESWARDKDVALALAELEKRKARQAPLSYIPYPKQKLFHNTRVKERIFFAANQVGKSMSAAFEVAYHATGRYPDWWTGNTVAKPAHIWIGSQSYASQRQAAQYKLLGTTTPISTPEAIGTGALPRESITKITATRGVADSIDTILVKNSRGMTSTITFKTYEQEMSKWAGGTVDVIWMDEEAPYALYVEALMRITATNGIIFTTFTPLSGRTKLVERFYSESRPDRAVINMTAYEAGHLTKEAVDSKLESLPEWEREARIFGRPAAGEGRIIQLAESSYVVEPVKLQPHWPRIIGLDIGMLHPTAAVWLAWDRDRNILYAYDEYRQQSLKVSEHSGTLLLRGAGEFPVAWPHDASQRDHGSGESVMRQYKKLGLNMLPVHASSPETGNSLWASITNLVTLLQGGKLKIHSNLPMLREELLSYHQKDGKVVDVNDDLISALRYAVMMHKHSKTPDNLTVSERAFRKHVQPMARHVDIDPFERYG
jgi:phage terminase large subunit-like protein